MEKIDVKGWYNSYTKRQVKTGVNLRHFTIINELIASGLKRDSRVLEIGCGVGTLTSLIAKFVKKGKIVATDISDESIKIAQNELSSHLNAEFLVTDMMDFTYAEKFDIIVLPDVLEHIPIEQHLNLFESISKLMHEKSRIVINIPHPRALDYFREHTPEQLQIIDQSLDAGRLIADCHSNGLILVSYRSHSIFYENPDYALIKFRKDVPVKMKKRSQKTIIKNKMKARLKFLFSVK